MAENAPPPPGPRQQEGDCPNSERAGPDFNLAWATGLEASASKPQPYQPEIRKP